MRAHTLSKHKDTSISKVLTTIKENRSLHYRRLKSKLKVATTSNFVSGSEVVKYFKSMREANDIQRTWGFDKLYYRLRNQGIKVCKKRAHRLYKEAGLSLYRRVRKQRPKPKCVELKAPEQVNEGWAMDFMSDFIVKYEGLQNSKAIRVINIMDEGSRKNLWVEAAKSIKAPALLDILDKVIEYRGKAPSYIRVDNGPEFISDALKKWAKSKHIDLLYIQPGKPTQNAFVERLNGTIRRECLDLHWFYSMEEINKKLSEWSEHYNNVRPHDVLKHKTPNQYEEVLKSKLYFKTVAA